MNANFYSNSDDGTQPVKKKDLYNARYKHKEQIKFFNGELINVRALKLTGLDHFIQDIVISPTIKIC